MRFSQPLFLFPLLFIGSTRGDYHDNAHAAISAIQNKFYDSNTGLWYVGRIYVEVHELIYCRDKTWWESANILTAIAKFGYIDSSFKQTAKDIVSNTYAKSRSHDTAPNWINDYYDDIGWWALAWIASYDLTGDSKYLNTAKDLFEDMTGGWTTPCGGGIWWNKEKTSIASIANELFLSVAAHLANRDPGGKQNYIRWAQAEWDWFSRSGVINSDNLINDGIDKSSCKNNGQKVWTYNQGVILGGLAELAKATNNGAYTNAAKNIAEGAFNKLTENGILTEQSTSLDAQSAQFKGAFVRGLAALRAQAPQQKYKDFLHKNADSAWSKDKNSEGLIGPKWQGGQQGPFSATSHASGVDLLVAAALHE
jgi:predicted alpha-1,6-mannanase (GH76 family)